MAMTLKLFPSFSWLLICGLVIALLGNTCTAAEAEKKVCIVYMGDLPKGEVSVASVHKNMLEQVVGSTVDASTLLYSYRRTFNGFVAKLTQEEMNKMKDMEGVVSVFPSETKQLHTTRSWDFTGFPKNVKRTTVESDVIVGMLDTGIWPESESFSDQGLGPPPSKWKGSCSVQNFTCNNKIIGARFYNNEGELDDGEVESPRDTIGHGTHTSSTAAGQMVEASLFGIGAGIARGAVPSSRIAVYKICWEDRCSEANILAAFDDAIADGVDIISLSVGGRLKDYFEDAIAIGAFHSMKNGILTSNSAGNFGPSLASITNVSPWSLSVAASTIDRKFITKLRLGNGKEYEGIPINTYELKKESYPLIYGGDAPNKAKGFDSSTSRYCGTGSLDESLVKGKIVLCDGVHAGEAVQAAGGVGTAMLDEHLPDYASNFELPATRISLEDGGNVSQYINSTSQPTAKIFKTTAVKDSMAPVVASFSSRGPNPITSDILKPDLTAPGVNILAAWSEGTTMTGSPSDERRVKYNIISGTSMSCPHATGAAAYVKSFHPTWSAAALKSALMTTAYTMTAASNEDAEFAYGSGHLNPTKARSPGLIYDASELDFINFLCGQGYSSNKLRLITGDKTTCSRATNGTVWDLNYPSFALDVTQMKTINKSFRRTVTNVGSASSVYKATVTAPAGITIEVVPKVLKFEALGETRSFVVTITGKLTGLMGSGALLWNDGQFQVRSPIVVYAQSGRS